MLIWSQTDTYTTVSYNYFDIYKNNTFDKCAGTLTLRHGNYATIEKISFWGEV